MNVMPKDGSLQSPSDLNLAPGSHLHQTLTVVTHRDNIPSTPSTAASDAETISTNDADARHCDVWELFSNDATSSRPPTGPTTLRSWTLESSRLSECGDDQCRPAESLGDEEEGSLRLSMDQLPRAVEQDTRVFVIEVATESQNLQEENTDIPAASSQEGVEPQHVIQPETQGNVNDVIPRPSSQQRIQVFVRVRPTPKLEGGSDCVSCVETHKCIRVSSSATGSVTECQFDRVFSDTSSQEDVWGAVLPNIDAALAGFNATVFAYGQTGTGKTHTIFGDEIDPASLQIDTANLPPLSWGIIPRAIAHLVAQTATRSHLGQSRFELQFSFLQIYNDRVFDLLTDKKRQKPLVIRELPTIEGGTSVVLQGLSCERFTSTADALQLLVRGRRNRSIRETEYNSSSSRSHAIAQINVMTETALGNGEKCVRKSRLNLVDLAGSEKWNTDVDMEDQHSLELKNINSSLSALGNCIAALAEAGRRHIPYRDSSLTRVLQDSFGGNTQSCLIATISPAAKFCEETLRTLQFADRARSVMQVVRVNETITGNTELLMARAQIAKLKGRLEAELRRRKESRIKETEIMQREFAVALEVKENELKKYQRDNEVFAKWREEDTKKIRSLEVQLRELQSELERSRSQALHLGPEQDTDTEREYRYEDEENNQKSVDRNFKYSGIPVAKNQQDGASSSADRNHKKSYQSLLDRYALGSRAEKPSMSQFGSIPSNDKPWIAQDAHFNSPVAREPYGYAVGGLNQSFPEKVNGLLRSTSGADVCNSTGLNGLAGYDKLMADRNVERSQSLRNITTEPTVERVSAYESWSTYSKDLSIVSGNKEVAPEIPDKRFANVCGKPAPPSQSDLRNQQLQSYSVSKPTWHLPPMADVSIGEVVQPTDHSHGINIVSAEKCNKHNLKGCVLCAAKGTSNSLSSSHQQTITAFQSAILAPSRLGDSSSSSMDVSLATRCDRHHLPNCFICQKPSSSTSVPVSGASPGSSTFSAYTGAGRLNVQRSFADRKCSTHSLSNCILCTNARPPPETSIRNNAILEAHQQTSTLLSKPAHPPQSTIPLHTMALANPRYAEPGSQLQHSHSGLASTFSHSIPDFRHMEQQSRHVSVGNFTEPHSEQPPRQVQVTQATNHHPEPPSPYSTTSPTRYAGQQISSSVATRRSIKELVTDSSSRRQYQALLREASDAATIALRRR